MPVKDNDKVYFKIKSGDIKTGVYDAKTKMVMMSGGKRAKPPKRALHHTRKGAMDEPFVDVTNKDPILGAKPTKKNEKATPKLSRAQYLGTKFSWSVFWSKNGAAGLKDYSSMPERIFHAAFKNKDDAMDKKRRNSIFSKLQQLIGDGNMSDGTTWKTITKKDVEKIIK
jgi:hypothetical protein